jgi:hypothetical protein
MVCIGNAFNKKDKVGLLKKIEIKIKIGISFNDILKQLISKEKNGCKKDILKKIDKDITSKGMTIQEGLRRNGIIGNYEYEIINNSKNFQEGIKIVIESLTTNKPFFAYFIGLWISLMIYGNIIGGTLYFSADFLVDTNNTIVQGLSKKDLMSLELIEFEYFNDKSLITLPWMIFNIFLFLMISVVLFSEKTKLYHTYYKLFKMPMLLMEKNILRMILNLYKTQGLSLFKISDILYSSLHKSSPVYKEFFSLLKKNENDNQKFSATLLKFGFNDELSELIEIGEEGKDLSEGITKAIEYADFLIEEKISFLNNIKMFVGLFGKIGIILVLFMIFGTVLFNQLSIMSLV